MTTNYTMIPPTGKTDITVNGHPYSCPVGSAIPVPDFDAIVMLANGWTRVPTEGASLSGGIAAQPTSVPFASITGKPVIPSSTKCGHATLASGSCTVTDTTTTAASCIVAMQLADAGTPGRLKVASVVAGASFDIVSSSATDTSTISWVKIEP